jgi:predicted RNA-binding Zn-ribbon protein involved in translation (DUF1610 family)
MPDQETIKFACPHCAQSIEAPIEMVGAETQCPTCGKTIIVRSVQIPPARSVPPMAAIAGDAMLRKTSRTAKNISTAGKLMIIIGIVIAGYGFLRRSTDEFDMKYGVQKVMADNARERTRKMTDLNAKPHTAEEWDKLKKDSKDEEEFDKKFELEKQSAIQPRFTSTEWIGAVFVTAGLATVCCAQFWHIRAALEK